MTEKTVLLVIDIQKGITDERLFAFEEFRKNVGALIAAARKSGMEVVYVRHDDGEGSGFSAGDDAFEIFPEFAPAEGEKIFDKTINSAFHKSTGLLNYLKNRGVRKVIAVGLQTDYCMDATVKSGFENGLEMVVPAYCNSTRGNAYMDAGTTYRFFNEFMWPKRYASCISFGEALKMAEEYKTSEAEDSANREEELHPCGTLQIETDRLILRQFNYSDADSMMRNWVSDDEVQWMYGEPSYKTKEEVRKLLDGYIGGYRSGYYYRWAIIEKESGECIGQIAYFLVDTHNHFGEIEYCIGRKFQGRGYATEATKAVKEFGFDQINFHKVQICVRPSNISSRRVIEKTGVHYDGTLRDYFFRDGAYEDRMYFSVLKSERGADSSQ